MPLGKLCQNIMQTICLSSENHEIDLYKIILKLALENHVHSKQLFTGYLTTHAQRRQIFSDENHDKRAWC